MKYRAFLYPAERRGQFLSPSRLSRQVTRLLLTLTVAAGFASGPVNSFAADAASEHAELIARRGELETAVSQAPTDPVPKVRLAEVLLALGEDETAHNAAQQGLSGLRADEGASGSLAADAHLVIATVERRAGRLAAAIRSYQATLAADSARLPALIGLAGSLAEAGYHREAIPAFGIWIQEQPEEPAARLGAASAMIFAGEHARAKVVLEEAHTAVPDNLDILDLLARHLAASPDRAVRNGQRAVELSLALVQKVPTPESHETLAMAYAEAGQREAAVEVQGKLIEELASEADRQTLERWRANMQRYRSGLSCCAGQS